MGKSWDYFLFLQQTMFHDTGGYMDKNIQLNHVSHFPIKFPWNLHENANKNTA